jgi:hypothetical protein
MKKSVFWDVTRAVIGNRRTLEVDAKFLRNVVSYKSHTRDIPEDAILQLQNSLCNAKVNKVLMPILKHINSFRKKISHFSLMHLNISLICVPSPS